MAVRKPLVLNPTTGRPEVLQAADSINVASSTYNSRAGANANAGALVIGTPIYASAAGSINKAQANAAATSNCIGLMLDVSTAAAASGSYVTDGVLTASTGQWDAVTGGTGGLVFNTVYFLDPATAGRLTATPPTTVGQYVVEIGTAISTTDLDVNIQTPILL